MKGQSALGIYDLAGNVYEWIADDYEENFYQNSPLNDPFNISNSASYKVAKREHGVLQIFLSCGHSGDLISHLEWLEMISDLDVQVIMLLSDIYDTKDGDNLSTKVLAIKTDRNALFACENVRNKLHFYWQIIFLSITYKKKSFPK